MAVLAAALMPFITSAGCHAHVLHNAPAEELPHVSWLIAGGDDALEVNELCGTHLPGKACVLLATTAEKQQFATFLLDFHSASTQVQYAGTVVIGFMAAPVRTYEVGQSVAPSARYVSTGISILVAETPGAYTVEMDLTATTNGATYPIRLAVPVEVKRPAGARAVDAAAGAR